VWPDEYPKDMPRPKIGDRHFDEDTNTNQIVTRLLHHETGEDLLVIEDATGAAVAVMTATGTSLDPNASFDGDLGDNVAGWEEPTPFYPTEPAERIAETELTAADFAMTEFPLSTLTKKIAAMDDVDDLRRLARAEQAGRGRGLKTRAGVMAAVETRLASLEIVGNLGGDL